MKKITVLSMGMCAVLALASCGTSKESAYKKAYEKAQQQELATLLFYSTQTIYNYKAAIRKRAKDLTTFDAAINRLCNVIG